MNESLNKLRIFAASPSDVASERAKLETIVDSLKPMADYLGLTLEVVDWRAVVPDAGRAQQVIFDQLQPTSWDIFIGILWHRFGTPPGAKDKTSKDYLSGTEEEFKTAYGLWRQQRKPRMVLYRCTRALPFDVDPDQLKNVREFFKLIEDVKGDYPTLYQTFDTTESFEKLVLHNLQRLLIEYGEKKKTPITPQVVRVLAPKILNNLPPRQAFFGRAKEMETVMVALSPVDRTWGVLVDGIGGIGKTAIAIEAAYRVQEVALFDAFVFVTAKTNILEPSGIKKLNPPARTLDEFLKETARVLGQPEIAKLTSDKRRSAILDVLRSMHTLLIYDNLETLSKEEQEGIAEFLRGLPLGCKAIVTSRRRGGEGGVWLHVEKLDWEAAGGIIKNEMERDAVLASKLNMVGEARWQELFDETNGSPLTLVHTLGLMRVRTTLTFNDALKMLRGNRDKDIQIFIFQEARKELTENDKAALGALSFFEPSVAFESWQQVANLSRSALATTIDRLSALSLVDVDVLEGEERYVLHPLTRAFVRDKLLTKTIAHETSIRFARYWGDYANRYGSKKYNTFRKLDSEWSNLEAAANWLWKNVNSQGKLMEISDSARMLNDLIIALNDFLWLYGRWDEQFELNSHAYELMKSTKDWVNAGTYAYNLASICLIRGHDDATIWVKRCVQAWSRSGSKFHQGIGRKMQGLVAEKNGKYDKAKRFYQDALALFRDLGKDEWIVGLLNDYGNLAYKLNDLKMAKQYYLEGMQLAKKIGYKDLQVYLADSLGGLARNQGHLKVANDWFKREFTLAKDIGFVEGIANAQFGLALVQESKKHPDKALSLAQEALKIYKRLQISKAAEVRELIERLKEQVEIKSIEPRSNPRAPVRHKRRSIGTAKE